MTEKIITRIAETSFASKEEITTLILEKDTRFLFSTAEEMTLKIFGNDIHIRGIIEFSNHCRCNCHYCGIGAFNNTLQRYRLDASEILEIAKEAVAAGYKSIVLQSGEDLYYDADTISQLIRSIKAMGDIAITLSIGERTYEEYKQWRQDGADRYLLKHETADEALYNQYHPHSSFDRKIQCLENLKCLGYQTGSGFMVGLPGQTYESLADDILLLKKLDVDMAGIGVFIAHPKTPLAGHLSGDNLAALKCVAITRILLKRPHLPSTTSISVNNKDTRFNPFCAGANVVMKKLEPFKYQKLYEIYPNTAIKDMTISETRKSLEQFIQSMDRNVSLKRGDAVEV